MKSLPTSTLATGLTVTVSAEKAQKPARLTNFKIGLSVPGLDDQRHRDGILRVPKSCLIRNTLTHAPVIDVEFKSDVMLPLAVER